jgi:MoxR-like ATPase
VPHPSPETLAAAAADLAGSHPLTIVTIPALLRAYTQLDDTGFLNEGGVAVIPGFGTRQERPVLEAFRTRDDRKSPYLAVWQDPPSYIRADYPGSTLQRLRTQDLLGQELFAIAWNDTHNKRLGTGLRPTAGEALARHQTKPVQRLSLALWLGRDQDLPNLAAFLDWFDEQYPLHATDLGGFYVRSLPDYATPTKPMEGLLWGDKPSNDDIVAVIQPVTSQGEELDLPSTTPVRVTSAPDDATTPTATDDPQPDNDLRWTRDFCAYPLRDADVSRITADVLNRLENKRIELPDAEPLIRRCVTALLVGHLVLQGPPGTGKTTLARMLAKAFDVGLLPSTATSEWSPFHVVGGLRPAHDNTLQPSYGKVTDAVLKCAVHVRADVTAEADNTEGPAAVQARCRQGSWLFIDEFNRADIDKAIGSLYTVLSSCSAEDLEDSPIDLWFETEGRQQLWVPARFRIIAAMNDLDTSFVNPISQGLTRRFQFITVGTPAADHSPGISAETRNSLQAAYEWLTETYGAVLTVATLEDITAQLGDQIAALQTIIAGLRQTSDTVAGWPIGTAQLLDVFRVLLLQTASGVKAQEALDWGIADRLVPQMGQLDELQHERAHQLLADVPHSQAALRHLINPHGV